MAPGKAKAPRAATSERGHRALSTSKKPLGALPAVGKRKRSGSDCSSVFNDDDNIRKQPSRSAKKRQASSANAPVAYAGEDGGTSPANAGSGGSGPNKPKDADPPVGAAGVRKSRGGIDTNLPPISDVSEMFEDMIERLKPIALKESPLKLNVATLCSGTDAPIFALGLIQEALQAMGFGAGFEFEHLFSCEIEPFKQGFIRRNLPHGTLIFRDVVELANAVPTGQATTAGGSKAAIPAEKLDILFAGCSCVDYSNMNQHKPSGRVPSLDRHLKQQPKRKGGRGNGKNPSRNVENDAPSPLKLNEVFVQDLDPGLYELLQLSRSESARTFFAALKLITAIRPKMVVLENVFSAPWDMYTEQIFPKIYYVARVIKLDSKNFYLPQTRQRGYLVAVDAGHFGEEQATRIAREWGVQLSNCKRSPSAPISAFLRPADDPATIQARAGMEGKPSQNTEWALCALRHADARQKNGIQRDDNPFSKKAMRHGRLIFATYPSHSWLRFWDSQPARVVDLMDIAFAIAHKEGADLGYKTGMIDVSQNVDRNSFVLSSGAVVKKNLGIIGCITPCGLPIVTDMMRPVTGTETLALQGLPVDELTISTETQAQLRDLAGNAMTVTVVGAVTLSLLLAISATGTDPALLNRIESAQPKRGLYLEAPPGELMVVGRASGPTTGFEPLLAIAKDMVRSCHCPTQAKEVFVCKACGTTACSTCRGNPAHDFAAAKKIAGVRDTAEHGKVRLKDLLPNALKLPIPLPIIHHGLTPVKEELYSLVVYDILAKGAVYYLDEIKVTEVVTVCYKAANSIARLVLSSDFGCCWYIYIAPWHPCRTRLSSIFDLDQPVARGQLSSDSPTVPQWFVWTLDHISLTLDLAKDEAGPLFASNLSFAADYDAEPNASLLAWKKSVEGKVCGTYFHRPACGTAGNALRIKQSSTTASRVFMMWDSAGLRNPADDHFVWTDTVRRLEPHEYRETLLHAKPTLAWKLDAILEPVSVFWPGYWSFPSNYPDAPKLGKQLLAQDLVHLHWGSTETIQHASCHATGLPPATHMPVLATVTSTLHEFPASAARLSRIDTRQTSGDFYVIPTAGCDAFLRLFAFLSSELRRSRAPENIALYPHLDGKWVQIDSCRDCSVTPPEITVYTKKDQKKGRRGELRFIKAIIEDPDEAALFERQYQDLPRALAVAARLLHSNDGTLAIDMRLMLQPKTLASRALAYLVQAHRTATRGRLALDSEAEASFTVMLDHAPSSNTKFMPFGDSVQPCGKEYTVGIDLASEYKLPDAGPPRFCRRFKKGRTMTSVEHKLRPSQREAVEWMLQREHAPLDFVESEIEEEVVAPLNLRVVGKAEWANRFPYSSRGGVVAHEIGYGKTVVTLALLDYMRAFDKDGSIAERKEKVDGAWLQELPQPFEHLGDTDLAYSGIKAKSFFHHLSATLVIVPKHITDQWAAEAGRFLGLTKPKLLVIKTMAFFYDKLSLRGLQEAEIIIISSAVFGPKFLDRLQTVAGRGTDYPKGLSGRTLETWYRGALRHHRILTAYYLAGHDAGIPHDKLMTSINQNLLPGLIQNQQANVDALVGKQVLEIDRQVYKKTAERAINSASGSGSEDSKQGNGSQDSKLKVMAEDEPWSISWLHNCSFARVIWDECSYDDDDYIRLFARNAVANAKWLISGTPKLFGLEQVCDIAAVFGLHVARPEPRMMPGLPAVTRGPKLDPMSKSEEFHVFSSRVKSAALAHERHSHAQTFVAAYFRANNLDAEIGIEVVERVVPVDMTASNAVRYHLLNQELLDAGYDYTALPAHARGDVALRGVDLVGRDGSSAAKMLLGLLACGLGEGRNSIDALKKDLAARSDLLSDQIKLLWDKTMWLRRWMLELMREDPSYKLSTPVQDTLERVGILCTSLSETSLGVRDSEAFGGKEMFQREALIVAGLWKPQEQDSPNAQSAIDTLLAAPKMYFDDDWPDHYNKNKALFTWLDFFDIEGSALDRLAPYQIRLLAEDVCWLRYKINPHAPPLEDGLPNVGFLRSALKPDSSKIGPRSIPATIEQVVASDILVLQAVNDENLEKFVRACVKAKPVTRTWQNDQQSLQFVADPNKRVKLALQERLTELNLKFSSNHTVPKLKEILWQHQTGLSICEQYRDGRAPPDRHQDLEKATCFSGTTAKQMEATNEELKRTIVHLAKTVEDLRATTQEASFLPEYSSLADAGDKDCVVRRKLCCSCRQPLGSASSSFLVVACGHFLCSGCKFAVGFYCPVEHCPAFIRKRPVLQCSQVPRSSDEPFAKAERIALFIRDEIPKSDFVVVFAQYRLLIEALAKAFRNIGLTYLNLATTTDNTIAKELEKFKTGAAGQILLLDMDSETSAGSNLTNATHVIFANPYVHYDEEHQTRTVRQARGRCVRTGQTETVRVYHFLVPGTIEEETLRKSGSDSVAVKKYFKDSDSKPWWIDEVVDDGEAGITEAED